MDSGACVIVVACVGATPSLSPVLAASKKGRLFQQCPCCQVLCPCTATQGGGMSVSRASVSAADAASRASCPPA